MRFEEAMNKTQIISHEVGITTPTFQMRKLSPWRLSISSGSPKLVDGKTMTNTQVMLHSKPSLHTTVPLSIQALCSQSLSP